MAVRSRRVVALLAVCVTVASCVPGLGGGQDRPRADDRPPPGRPLPAEFDGEDFYAVPDPLPRGRHGTLIRYQRVDDPPVVGGTRTRIMYLSETVAGDPVAVTGTVVVPDGSAPPGGRDVVSVAHGTTGIADGCTPSKNLDTGENLLAPVVVQSGRVMVMTDYEGLGTPGRHPYLVGEAEGRNVLDAATAAGQLPGAEASRRVGVVGYSQGGHAALWAGQVAPRWARGLDVVGIAAGAPSTGLPLYFSFAQTQPTIIGFLLMIVAGYEAAYPDEADPALVLSPDGESVLDTVDDGCVADILARFAGTVGGPLLQPDAGTVEPWATLMAANDPGHAKIRTPVLVTVSIADEVVPSPLVDTLVDRMCERGTAVEGRPYPDGGGHVDTATRSYLDGLAWLAARFARQPAVSTCA
jgi:pimeloyl-ACP methyl ester carboxylesterase